MRVLVTGATGFLGRHLVAELLTRSHEVTATARSVPKAQTCAWYPGVRFVPFSIGDSCGQFFDAIGEIDTLVHLAWSGLPNYQDRAHLIDNLESHSDFLRFAVAAGVSKVMVVGTCLEYGMQSGCLSETAPAQPENPYALAKNKLRLNL